MKNKKAARLITAGLVTTMTVGMLAAAAERTKGAKARRQKAGRQ